MDSSILIKRFLDRIRARRTACSFFSGLYLLLGVILATTLLGSIIFRFAPAPNLFALPFFFTAAALAGYVLVRHLMMEPLRRFSHDQAALLVETHHPRLNNALINSWQLQRHITAPLPQFKVSAAFINKLIIDTSESIKDIAIDSVISRKELNRHRNAFLLAALAVGLTQLLQPDFFARSYTNLVNAPAPAAPAPAVADKKPEAAIPPPDPEYTVTLTTLEYHFPAYTRLKTAIAKNPDGRVEVLPGTEIKIEAQSNLPVEAAELILNGAEQYAMSVQDGKVLTSALIVKEPGFYQFGVKTQSGKKLILPHKYPLLIKKDQPPKIAIFLSNPKPVYEHDEKITFSYEGVDDFGIQKIDLLWNAGGRTGRLPLKNLKGQEKSVKESYTWNLEDMDAEPGEQAQYFLEITDNDNVLGPNVSHSEIHSFTMLDAKKEFNDVIAMQEELTERLLSLLAIVLVDNQLIMSGGVEDPKAIRRFLTATTDQLAHIVELARKTGSQGKEIASFPATYAALFENIVTGLTQVRKEYIDIIKTLDDSINTTVPIGFNFPPVIPANEKLITQLERNLIYLIKTSNRLKMEQALDTKDRLTNLTQSLREEFEKAQSGKKNINLSSVGKQVEKIRKTLQTMMEQLSRQTQGLADEFLNPGSIQQLNMEQMDAALNQVMELAKQGKIEEALAKLGELSKELDTLSHQMKEAEKLMSKMVDPKIMEKINESLQHLQKMEKEESRLLEDTARINQALRSAQNERFHDNLESFFDSVKKDIAGIQSILKSTETFTEQHPRFKEWSELTKEEAHLALERQELSQKAVDSALKPDLALKFKELNGANGKTSDLAKRKADLHMKIYSDFKEALPEFKEKYKNLAELAESKDFSDFNALFKNTYPLTFNWQHNLRLESKPDPEIADRLENDLDEIRKLNSQISKKLGSMGQELQQSLNSLLTEKERADLRQLAKQQNQLRQETEDLGQDFAEMNAQNPVITPELFMKMSGAGNFMQSASKNLNEANLQQSIDSENKALQKLTEARELLSELKGEQNGEGDKKSANSSTKLGSGSMADPRPGGAVRMRREKVTLPGEDQYQPPEEFRTDILQAMKRQYPKKYERFVTEYYKELVK